MNRLLTFSSAPAIVGSAAVAGHFEAQGPLAQSFRIVSDDKCGAKTWEQAESGLLREAVNDAMANAGLPTVDTIFAGDLQNQCTASSFALRNRKIPVVGLYSACATFGEGLILAAMLVNGGHAETAASAASSHFCAAERQYRMPLEYGGQRTQTAQWTATAAGCAVIGKSGDIHITHGMPGRIIDLGINDPANMGAAMAPAAADTIAAVFDEYGDRFDMIATGDLGKFGSEMLYELLGEKGIAVGDRHFDCGRSMYDFEKQDVHAGGSGAGCCAAVFCGFLMKKLRTGEIRRLLFCPTGALLSPVLSAQKETIPAICHAVILEK